MEFINERVVLHRRQLPTPLTDPSEEFSSPEYQPFYELKRKLVEQQTELSGLDIVEWHKSTGRLHPAALTLRRLRGEYHKESVPLITQAWLKFAEILAEFPELTKTAKVTSCHLCEAPGAFISALVHFCSARRISLEWEASSLNPWHEESETKALINIDTLVLAFPEKWFFGRENTGDIFDLNALFHQKSEKYWLITSDGGFDCSADPENQEQLSAGLKLAEYEAIISRLQLHGCAVLKLFASCHETTLRLLEGAANGFDRAFLTKPASSKAGNSEQYLVMIGFKGHEAAKVKPNTQHFLGMVESIVAEFIQRQIDAIKHNLKTAPEFENQETSKQIDAKIQAASDQQFKRWNLKGMSFR